MSAGLGTTAASAHVRVQELTGPDLIERLSSLEAYVARTGPLPLSRHPAWLVVLERALGHRPYCLQAERGGKLVGFLALSHVRSLLFGRYLVSLPYLNYGGPLADDDDIAKALVNRAVAVADQLGVKNLELRHERAFDHPMLVHQVCTKVNVRLSLPSMSATLWDRLNPKVRNQVRKGQKSALTVSWGGEELLTEFYAVFSRNMRDLGTPVYGAKLFGAVLRQFPERAELVVVRAGATAIAAALLLHGWGITEVPSASALRSYNHTNANMLMYWSMLDRAMARGQSCFDFGRSTRDGGTYRFKLQWGASPETACWQHYLRTGSVTDVRPESPGFQHLIRVWKKLPVGLTRLIGPSIVRGIP